MERTNILFIDDELPTSQAGPDGRYMWYYTEALRDAGFKVIEVEGPDSALRKLSLKTGEVDLVILDIMIPPGKAYAEENTLNGLRTGIFLSMTIQEEYPRLPIVVLTNVLNPDALNQLKPMKSVKKILTKPHCTPFQLVEEIYKI